MAIAATVATAGTIVVHTEHLFICIRQLHTHQLILPDQFVTTGTHNTALAVNRQLWSKREGELLTEAFVFLSLNV